MKSELVLYYLDGWRAGWVVRQEKDRVVIQPIGAIGGAKPRQIKVSVRDIKACK